MYHHLFNLCVVQERIIFRVRDVRYEREKQLIFTTATYQISVKGIGSTARNLNCSGPMNMEPAMETTPKLEGGVMEV